jgi:hypothetical protein
VKTKYGLFSLFSLFSLFFVGNDGCGKRTKIAALSYPLPLAEISVDSLVAGW